MFTHFCTSWRSKRFSYRLINNDGLFCVFEMLDLLYGAPNRCSHLGERSAVYFGEMPNEIEQHSFVFDVVLVNLSCKFVMTSITFDKSVHGVLNYFFLP